MATQKKSAATAPQAPAPAPTPKGKLKFKANEFVVYPAHGVGKIVDVEEQEIAGAKLELYVIDFLKEKMRLRVPTAKAESVGMRKLADKNLIEQAMKVLKGRAKIKRTMWSRRAQEYEAKINSGDIIAVAEVVRDLFRSDRQPEQSYSERQLFEAALDRMAREIAAVKKVPKPWPNWKASSTRPRARMKRPPKTPPPKRPPDLPSHRTQTKTRQAIAGFFSCGVPEGIRTPDPRFRKPVLYPAELPGLKILSHANRMSLHQGQ